MRVRKVTLGGLNGYSGLKCISRKKTPPSYTEPGGPRIVETHSYILSPFGPALQFGGGSMVISANSFWILFAEVESAFEPLVAFARSLFFEEDEPPVPAEAEVDAMFLRYDTFKFLVAWFHKPEIQYGCIDPKYGQLSTITSIDCSWLGILYFQSYF